MAQTCSATKKIAYVLALDDVIDVEAEILLLLFVERCSRSEEGEDLPYMAGASLIAKSRRCRSDDQLQLTGAA